MGRGVRATAAVVLLAAMPVTTALAADLVPLNPPAPAPVANPAPRWTVEAGVEVRTLPHYQGSEVYGVYPFPLLDVRAAGTPPNNPITASTRASAAVRMVLPPRCCGGLPQEPVIDERSDEHICESWFFCQCAQRSVGQNGVTWTKPGMFPPTCLLLPRCSATGSELASL